MASAGMPSAAAAPRLVDAHDAVGDGYSLWTRRLDGHCRRSPSPISPMYSAQSSSTRRRAPPGVKPVIGCDVWLSNESERDKPHRLLLLVQSRAGYLRLWSC